VLGIGDLWMDAFDRYLFFRLDGICLHTGWLAGACLYGMERTFFDGIEGWVLGCIDGWMHAC
jgi:hypothetical protein